jgi:predicted PurR-regulated permease PerM
VAIQISSLADELPAYRENIREKIADIRGAGQRGSLQKVQEAVKDIQQEITKSAEPSRPPAGAPVTVVQADGATDLWSFPTTLGPVVDALATAGLVIILVVFMLLERADLRNRFIRLAGFRRLTVTTKAFDEAASRISRYLLRQTIINGTLGLGIGVGLFFIGVPHALVWGFLAAVLRFIPYVGVWIAALPPVVLSLAMFPGWARPLLVIALVIVIELVTSMLLEPLLYAGAAGVSEVGLLVAIAFWTWLWGALGLLMATPLTVCLVVVAKYVPGMRFLITSPPSPPTSPTTSGSWPATVTRPWRSWRRTSPRRRLPRACTTPSFCPR